MSSHKAVPEVAPTVQLDPLSNEALISQASIDNPSSNIPSGPLPFEPGVEAERLSIEVAASLPAIKDLRRVWRKWTHGLNTDIDYFSHNLKTDSSIVRPHVITVWKDGVAQAMLVGQVRSRRVSTVVSFIKIPGPYVKVLEILNGGRMGRPSPAIDKLLALQLLQAIRSGGVDLLCFQRLPLHSDLFREVQRLPGLLVRDRVPHIFYYSILPLVPVQSGTAKSVSVLPGKARREVRRKTRILEREFPGQTQIRCFSEPGEMDAGIRDALAVAASTWQYRLGQGFSDNPRTHANLKFFTKKKWLRIYVLYLENRPCAFLIGQLFRNTFYCQYAGYHPDFGRFSVGSLLTAWAFQSLAEAGVKLVDLGEGGQEHNRRLGCQMREEGTVHVYSPTLRGLWLNMFFATSQIVRAGGRLARSSLRLNRVANIWQQRLISRSKQQPSLQMTNHANQ